MTNKPHTAPTYLSDCHNAAVYVVGSDEGTNHFECSTCKEACNFHSATPHTDPTDERLDEIVQTLGDICHQSYTGSQKDPNTYDSYEYCYKNEVVNLLDTPEAKAALLKWRDDHTERKCLESLKLLYWLYKEKNGQSVDTKFVEAYNQLIEEHAALNKKEEL